MSICVFVGGALGAAREREIVRPSTEIADTGFQRGPCDFPAHASLMKEDGVFSIIDCYLRLAGAGEIFSLSR